MDYGGRGSAKTWTWADAVVVEAALRPLRILVTREFQISIEESIKDEIETAIVNRGLEHFFDPKKTWIDGINGSKFIFKGIKNNIKNLKSISNVDVVLCEEAEDVQKDSWDKLLPSIRPKSGKDPVFIIIFNPDNELDNTYQRWVVSPPPNTISKLINWRDNKHFPEFLNNQRLHCKKTMPAKDYRHIWEGEPRGSGDEAIIDLQWVKAARWASKHPEWKKAGKKVAGYDPAGQGRDFNACVFVDGNELSEIDEWLKSADLREASKRAFAMALRNNCQSMEFDECGGYGDGVQIFIDDAKQECLKEYRSQNDHKSYKLLSDMEIIGFNAGSHVANPDSIIEGTAKTYDEMYTNLKAQGWGCWAQRFYNTFRFVVLGERDIEFSDMISLNIDDDELFTKLARELSTPIWVKSASTSKKKVESKADMEKRTGLPSPNIADALIMCDDPASENTFSDLLKLSMG